MEPLEIDGAYGEGGGQIIRSAVSLSCITGRPIRLVNIRRNRRVGGLRPQHLTSVRILQRISNAEVSGAEIGSAELGFVPRAIRGGEIAANVGTAGSIPLILQTIIPLAGTINQRLAVTVSGGTDVSWSPSMDYTRNVLREALGRMGMRFSIDVRRRGYYPRGGGAAELQVFPSSIRPISVAGRTSKDVKLSCTVSKIPVKDIRGDVERVRRDLEGRGFSVDVRITKEDAADAGSALLAYSIGDDSVYGTDALYDVARGGFDMNLDGITGDGFAIDANLADMLVVPASMAACTTRFHVGTITDHLKTNLFVTSKITGCRYGVGRISGGYEVIIEGVSDPGIEQRRKE